MCPHPNGGSLIVLPLDRDRNICGLLGYQALRRFGGWRSEEIELLEVVADVLGAAFARWRAEQALDLHKERLRRGQVFANIGTWDWNIDSGALFWSERIRPLFGYPDGESETSYENFIAAVYPEDRQTVLDAVDACLNRDVPYEIEHRVVWPNSSEHWLLERGAVVRDANGRASRMLGVVQDIDDRKRTVLALAQRERQLREAQALAHIGDWHADFRSGEVSWSDEVYRIFGQEAAIFVPDVDTFHAAVHPEDRTKVRASEERAKLTGMHDIVHRVVRPDGSVRHVRVLAQAETDTSGALVRMSGTVQDVTEVEEIESDLRRERDRAQRYLDTIQTVMLSLDPSGRITMINRRGCELLGFEEKELLGRHWFRCFLPAPQGMQQIYPEFRRIMSGPTTEFEYFENPALCRDGRQRLIAWHNAVLRDEKGSIVGVLSSGEDITERKKAEEALQKAREEAENANRAKSEFLSSMSHELRTPLNAILGFAQLLDLEGGFTEEQKDGVREIQKAGGHLLQLVNEVLDLAKIEAGHIEIRLEPTDVDPIVDECLLLVSTLAEERGVQLLYSGSESTAVRADRTRLMQALLNLLSNAIKYNRERGAVRVEVRPEGVERVQIRVSDTGPGIPPERFGELFRPFSRLDAKHSDVEGTGIGLAFTRRIVELMGGAVGVQSEVGIGSTFWIELPSQEATGRDREASAASGPCRVPQIPRIASKTVLYIEDNPANRTLVAQILKQRDNIRVVTAETPELGIELARGEDPDLILLHINLPRMSGYQVLEHFKGDVHLRDVPVIAISANAMPSDIETAKSAGFDEYITKPLDVARFLVTMDAFLGGQ